MPRLKTAKQLDWIEQAQPEPISVPVPEGNEFILPSHMQLSSDECAYVARFVRLLRDKYWATELVKVILNKEARARHMITTKWLRGVLEQFDGIELLTECARVLGEEWSGHPVMRAIRERDPEIADYKTAGEIDRLLKSAHTAAKK